MEAPTDSVSTGLGHEDAGPPGTGGTRAGGAGGTPAVAATGGAGGGPNLTGAGGTNTTGSGGVGVNGTGGAGTGGTGSSTGGNAATGGGAGTHATGTGGTTAGTGGATGGRGMAGAGGAGGQPAADVDSAQYNFETGTQSWQTSGAPVTSVSHSTAEHFAGNAALAVYIGERQGPRTRLRRRLPRRPARS